MNDTTINKTGRKNKTKLKVNWPSSHFTFKELWQTNKDFVDITLRVRLKNAVEEKKLVALGTKSVSKGRPELVYATTPVSNAVIEAAKNAGVDVMSSFTVKVTDVVDKNVSAENTPATQKA